MSKLNNHKVLSFRNFDKIDGTTSVVYELAWPVEVVECYANKVTDGALNALAEATLELFNVTEMSKKKVAELLMISDQVVSAIIKELEDKNYYDSKEKKITEEGKKYLADYEVGEYLEERVFGNMFISKMNGEVLPYFYEGQLPWERKNDSVLYFSYNKENKISDNKDLDLADKINRAYHKFADINRKSLAEISGNSKSDLEFYEEEMYELNFNEVEDLAEKKLDKNIDNARVKILDTERREAYIRTRLIVKKANPKQFIVESPFNINVTSWYSESFHRMREDNQHIYSNDGNEITLDLFCQDIIDMFYVKFPELKENDFEQYVKYQFPNMLSVKASNTFINKYNEVFNLNLLCNRNEVKRHTVITESAKAIELLLNNYIAEVDKKSISEKYIALAKSRAGVEEIFLSFEIKNCVAKSAELKAFKNRGNFVRRYSMINSFMNNWNGKSIKEKYFFLIIEAYLIESSKFRQLLLEEGNEIIDMFDFINSKRNKYGAHNDGIRLVEISDDDFEKYKDYFIKTTRLLIDYID